MTSTPVSLNDSSLNGSWIDINSASQIPSPMDNNGERPEFLLPPYSNQAESIENFGLISFQVERFLQEAAQQQQQNQQQLPSGNQEQANSNLNTSQPNSSRQPNTANKNNLDDAGCGDDNSGMYVSDAEVSLDGFDCTALMRNLRRIQQMEGNNNTSSSDSQTKKNHLYLVDQLSDSLSLLSRASGFGEPAFEQTNFEDFDWLWDWTAQPEYFTGQEWKVYAPKQDYLMRQRQLYHSHRDNLFSGEVVSLLFLTNFLSIIIGAGLTYSIMMRRSAV